MEWQALSETIASDELLLVNAHEIGPHGNALCHVRPAAVVAFLVNLVEDLGACANGKRLPDRF
jgi:hypothetical protein